MAECGMGGQQVGGEYSDFPKTWTVAQKQAKLPKVRTLYFLPSISGHGSRAWNIVVDE